MTVSQVALNWLIRDERVVAIPGAKTAEQVDEVAGAAGWRLTDSELLMIEEALAILKIEYLKSIPRMLLRALFRI
jgi:aryl-alcohol dehydrogenase-like predicted oxidoreductase